MMSRAWPKSTHSAQGWCGNCLGMEIDTRSIGSANILKSRVSLLKSHAKGLIYQSKIRSGRQLGAREPAMASNAIENVFR
jgi:hypothetical protein